MNSELNKTEITLSNYQNGFLYSAEMINYKVGYIFDHTLSVKPYAV